MPNVLTAARVIAGALAFLFRPRPPAARRASTEPDARCDDERGAHQEREPVAAPRVGLGFAAVPEPDAGSLLGNWNALRGERKGVMLHYDDSSSDASGVEWLTRDPACKVSYNDLILDNGTEVSIAPRAARAWHAGVCEPSSDAWVYDDANSAFYGVAVAAKAGDTVSPAQHAAVVAYCVRRFGEHGWAADDTWRITSHDLEAAPRGRKVDVGTGLQGLTLQTVRAGVRAALAGSA